MSKKKTVSTFDSISDKDQEKAIQEIVDLMEEYYDGIFQISVSHKKES